MEVTHLSILEPPLLQVVLAAILIANLVYLLLHFVLEFFKLRFQIFNLVHLEAENFVLLLQFETHLVNILALIFGVVFAFSALAPVVLTLIFVLDLV